MNLDWRCEGEIDRWIEGQILDVLCDDLGNEILEKQDRDERDLCLYRGIGRDQM